VKSEVIANFLQFISPAMYSVVDSFVSIRTLEDLCELRTRGILLHPDCLICF